MSYYPTVLAITKLSALILSHPIYLIFKYKKNKPLQYIKIGMMPA